MKCFLKDIIVSLLIGLLTFFTIFMINGDILFNDLYAQGLPFLGYFKDNFNIFKGDLIYSWGMGIGDSSYSYIIYYLMSPFNILLLLFKKVDMVDLLPFFMLFKIVMMIYFSSLYFKKVLKKPYRWLGVLLYVANYNIIMYGSIHIMWIDTFAFLPLVLLGIEKIINNEEKYTFLFSMFFLIITNYYLAALYFIQIAIYGIIRYMVVKGKSDLLKFIFKMILLGLLAICLSAFVLIPAVYFMLSSSKDVNTLSLIGTSIERLYDTLRFNVIGVTYSLSSTYFTIFGLLMFLPCIFFTKNRKQLLYLLPIGLLLLAVYSDKVNYLFNLGYEAFGGNYRYNIFINIYISLIICSGLDTIIRNKLRSVMCILPTYGIYTYIIISSNNIDYKYKVINLLFLNSYVLVIILIIYIYQKLQNKKEFIFNLGIIIINSLIIIEIFLYAYSINVPRDFVSQTHAKNVRNIVSYVGEKYGSNNRMEINDRNIAYNVYLSKGVLGVEGFHSLIKKEYREIGSIFTDTNFRKVKNKLSGRNIIVQLTGQKYYISSNQYCPYFNSKLLERHNDYYIYGIENNEIKYFDSIVNEMPKSMVEKDALLYSNLYIDNTNSTNYNNTVYTNNTETHDIHNNQFTVQENGDYYIIHSTPSVLKINTGSPILSINNIDIGSESYISSHENKEMNFTETYIGYLKKNDIVKLNFDLGKEAKIRKINDNYIKESIEKMNSVKDENIIRSSDKFHARFRIENDGYVVFPVIYDKSWKISENGQELNPIKVNNGFIALKLEPGTHDILMEYTPTAMYIGISISLITFLVILLYKFIKYIRQN